MDKLKVFSMRLVNPNALNYKKYNLQSYVHKKHHIDSLNNLTSTQTPYYEQRRTCGPLCFLTPNTSNQMSTSVIS